MKQTSKYLLATLLWGMVFLTPGVTRLVAQDWKTVAAKADVLVLTDSTHVQVADNGSGTFTIRNVRKIQTIQGALANRVIVYDYDPLTAFARFTDIKIIHPDGTFTVIDPATACDYAAPARSIYWGARQIMAEPGRLQVGDILDYTIEKKGFTYALLTMEPSFGVSSDDERFIPPMRGQFYDIIPFWVSTPTVRKTYKVTVPKDKELQYKFYQGACESSVLFEGTHTSYTFTAVNSLPPKREQGQADLFDVAPKLMLSSTPDWKAKSLWFHNVNEEYGSFEPTPEAQAKVNELIKGLTDEMDKIAVLTHWVADNMRYSGISMGKGEGYTLHNTRMNFTDRCGVCKDKAGMLISFLRMAGFEAYPAMTMAGSRIEAIPADHFNHCVAVVKLSDGKYIPLDPTWVPFIREVWSSAEQQQNYLPGIPQSSDLLKTPLSDPDNHYLRLSAKTQLSADGTLTGEFTIQAEGQSDNAVRRPFTTGFEDNIAKAMEAELLRVAPNAELIKYDAGKNPKDYQKAPISITMKFRIPEYATVGGNTLVCTPLVFSGLYRNNRNFMALDTKPETRVNGFTVRCSQRVVLDEVMTLPKGYLMTNTSRENPLSQGECATFAGSLTGMDNTVSIHQEVTLFKRVYEAWEWPEVRQAITAYQSYAQQPLVLIKK